jgi:hypothetical protein
VFWNIGSHFEPAPFNGLITLPLTRKDCQVILGLVQATEWSTAVCSTHVLSITEAMY